MGLARQPYDEMKQYSASAGSQVVFNAAGLVQIDVNAGITQGTSDSQRLGDHLYMDELVLSFTFFNGLGATANQFTSYRVCVFQFFGDGSVQNPLPGNLWLTSSQNNGNVVGMWSNYNIDYQEQYRVLWDSLDSTSNRAYPYVTYGTNGQATTGSSGVAQNSTMVCRIPLSRADRNIRYYAGGTTGPNHIYCNIVTDQNSNTTNPTVLYSYRVRFTDA